MHSLTLSLSHTHTHTNLCDKSDKGLCKVMRGTRPHLQLLHNIPGDHGSAGCGVVLQAVAELGDAAVTRDKKVL